MIRVEGKEIKHNTFQPRYSMCPVVVIRPQPFDAKFTIYYVIDNLTGQVVKTASTDRKKMVKVCGIMNSKVNKKK